MAKTATGKNFAAGERKLAVIREDLGELKTRLADLLMEYDETGADEDRMDQLTEVLDALEDAWDGLDEVLAEE